MDSSVHVLQQLHGNDLKVIFDNLSNSRRQKRSFRTFQAGGDGGDIFLRLQVFRTNITYDQNNQLWFCRKADPWI